MPEPILLARQRRGTLHSRTRPRELASRGGAILCLVVAGWLMGTCGTYHPAGVGAGIDGGGWGSGLAAASELRFTPIVRAVQAARPSVVSIHGRKRVRDGDQPASESFRQVNGMGTGVIIDERGYIITNYHVVEGVARIQVTTDEGETTLAQLIAHDPATDLAIIKIDLDRPLPVINIGISSDLMEGEPVVAVGNAYGYTQTITRGIISALHRSVRVSDTQKYDDLIQTDASINPGNSGGPLLNIDGKMIGVNVAVRVGAQGIGFALPIDQTLDVVERLMSVERQEGRSYGVVGETEIGAEDVRFVVRSLEPDSPAQNAGLQAGDYITEIRGITIKRGFDFERALLGIDSEEHVPVTVLRNNETLTVSMRIPTTTRSARVGNVATEVWDVLGLRLLPLPPGDETVAGSRYRGGLRVASVRPGGPAAKQGIRRGDTLVGMHKWETISLDNMAYILKSTEFQQVEPVKFFILRGDETLFGYLRVSQTD